MVFNFKLLSIIVILAISLLGGFFPILIKVNGHTKKWLHYAEAFAGGIFLGVGLIHLLPEANKIFLLESKSEYPLVFVLCAFTILFLRFIEEIPHKLLHISYHDTKSWIAYLLTILLSIHSLLEGTALGVEQSIAGFIIIFIAIIAHKGTESFALGVSMRKNMSNKSLMIKLMLLFSIMTPCGILFGSALTSLLDGKSGHFAQAIFNAIAAGTFIYIGAFHHLHLNNNTEHEETDMSHLLYFSFGLLFASIIAIWV